MIFLFCSSICAIVALFLLMFDKYTCVSPYKNIKIESALYSNLSRRFINEDKAKSYVVLRWISIVFLLLAGLLIVVHFVLPLTSVKIRKYLSVTKNDTDEKNIFKGDVLGFLKEFQNFYKTTKNALSYSDIRNYFTKWASLFNNNNMYRVCHNGSQNDPSECIFTPLLEYIENRNELYGIETERYYNIDLSVKYQESYTNNYTTLSIDEGKIHLKPENPEYVQKIILSLTDKKKNVQEILNYDLYNQYSETVNKNTFTYNNKDYNAKDGKMELVRKAKYGKKYLFIHVKPSNMSQALTMVKPVEVLEIGGSKYNLSGIIFKSGDKSGGHYTALIKQKDGYSMMNDSSTSNFDSLEEAVNSINTYVRFFAYIKDGSIQYSDHAVGLNNVGNTCWWAAGMQILFNMPEFLTDAKSSNALVTT